MTSPSFAALLQAPDDPLPLAAPVKKRRRKREAPPSIVFGGDVSVPKDPSFIRMNDILPESVSLLVSEFYHVGSTATCDPPPVGTDLDYLVRVRDVALATVQAELFNDGWTHSSGPQNAAKYARMKNEFASYRKGVYNLLLTTKTEFVERFLLATDVAKHLNLLDKTDRIVLFQAILYGNCPEDVLRK